MAAEIGGVEHLAKQQKVSKDMNDSNAQHQFFKTSAVLLIATSLAKLYAATGSARIFLVQDELLFLGYRPLMISAAILEIVVAMFLIRSRNNIRRCLALLWLSGNFLFYHWGSYILDVHHCPCLGNLTERLPLPPGSVEALLQLLVLYWFLTSLNGLWRTWGAEWCGLFRFMLRRAFGGGVVRET